MKRVRPVLRWLGRHGGMVVLAWLCVQFLVSRRYAMGVAVTSNEHVAFAAGMCCVVWRAVRNPDPWTEMDRPGVHFNDMGGSMWTSSFSHGLSQQHHFIWFPMWVLMIGAGLWAAAGLAWPRRPVPGRCGRCGYDLSGLAQGAACPECGLVPPNHRVRSSDGT